MVKKVSFTSMDQGTKEDYDLVSIHDSENERSLSNRVIQWLQMMFSLQIVLMRKSYISASPPPYGLPFALLLLKGSAMIAGINFDTIGGSTVAQKVLTSSRRARRS